jgi:hypothetical protein
VTAQKDENGRLKLTWAQVVWGITMLLGLAGMWTRMEVRLALIEVAVAGKAQASDVEQLRRDLRQHIGGVIVTPDAEAATRP